MRFLFVKRNMTLPKCPNMYRRDAYEYNMNMLYYE